MSDLTELEKQERDLQAQLEEIRRQKAASIAEANARAAAAAKEAELSKPVMLVVREFTGAMIVVKGDYRPDVVDIYKSIPGRMYRFGENMIPVAQWANFLERITPLKGVELRYDNGIEEKIDRHLNAPVWEIKLEQRHLVAIPGPRAQQWNMYSLPGNEYDSRRELWKLPRTEAWRLWEKLKDTEGVFWSPEAQEFVVSQIERRAKLDRVALMKRGEIYLDYDFGGTENKLRPFQEVGCEFVEYADGRALIADEMGLGKTWQALAYAHKNNLRTIVVCPASLKPNWAREIRKLTSVRPTILMGAEPQNWALQRMLIDPPQFSIINYDILGRKTDYQKITKDTEGYEHVENQTRFLWAELVNMSKPDLVIVDEGHYIKNVDSYRSQAVRSLKVPRIIFMTGTPVLNRPGELWPMLTMIAPDQFPAYETFLGQYTVDGKSAKNVEDLRSLLKTIMIRRLKKDVVSELPPINRINEYHELSERAVKAYQKVLEGVYLKIAAYDARGNSKEEAVTNILVQIMRLKQVCAIDKAERTADLAREVYEQTDPSENRKVLIFSQFKPTAYRIYQMLADDGCLSFVSKGRSEFITCNNNERDTLVQQFQTDPNIKYMVVTEKTTKEGHNITAAGHVIFNDLFWTPAGHEQAEGRAYGRLSDLHSINSYYMIVDMDGESIDEWIMELLAKKLHTIHQVVEGIEEERDASIAMDLIQKIRDSMWRK